jgi:hypothetical protein
MMYTRERLMKAVREAGRDGRQFTLGEVRAELGIKSRDKREQKRFRSRFRECTQILGDSLEKLGPNTFRLKAGYATEPAVQAAPGARPQPPQLARTRPAKAPVSASAPEDAPLSLIERVGVGAASNDDEWKRRPREQVSFVKAPAEEARQLTLSERISTWFGRPARPQPNNGAAVALSRLAVELQPKAAGFEYRWIDGKLEVQRANK